MGKRKVVISAVNFTTGGPLTILKDFLAATKDKTNVDFTALVHSEDDLKNKYPWITFKAFPKVKKSWFRRLFFEYYTSWHLSKKINATHWVCLHDITANVASCKRYVYCHNPSPFYKGISLNEIKLEPKFFVFKLLYSFFYRINIKKNDGVFVQQFWMRNEFINRYDIKNVIVSRPENIIQQADPDDSMLSPKVNKAINIFYPAVPRVFKNHELIIKAAEKLQGKVDVDFYITISGSENAYSKHIRSLGSHLKNIHFLGYLNQQDVQMNYQRADIVCFPSKLETWGLPLSEAKKYNKWVFASDFAFTRETLGEYRKKAFFNYADENELVDLIISFKNSLLKEDCSDANLLYQHEEKLTGFSELVSHILKES